jgi:hypothetical protein
MRKGPVDGVRALRSENLVDGVAGQEMAVETM